MNYLILKEKLIWSLKSPNKRSVERMSSYSTLLLLIQFALLFERVI